MHLIHMGVDMRNIFDVLRNNSESDLANQKQYQYKSHLISKQDLPALNFQLPLTPPPPPPRLPPPSPATLTLTNFLLHLFSSHPFSTPSIQLSPIFYSIYSVSSFNCTLIGTHTDLKTTSSLFLSKPAGQDSAWFSISVKYQLRVSKKGAPEVSA